MQRFLCTYLIIVDISSFDSLKPNISFPFSLNCPGMYGAVFIIYSFVSAVSYWTGFGRCLCSLLDWSSSALAHISSSGNSQEQIAKIENSWSSRPLHPTYILRLINRLWVSWTAYSNVEWINEEKYGGIFLRLNAQISEFFIWFFPISCKEKSILYKFNLRPCE